MAEAIGIAAIVEREQLTTEEVYRALAKTVFRWVEQLGGPGFDVDDAVQDVFATVHQKLSRFRGDSSLRRWVFGITSHIVYQHQRKLARRARPGGKPEQVAAQITSDDPSAIELLSSQEVQALVYSVLDRLHPRYRDILILFEIEDMSGEEVAELQGITVDALWVVLHRARKQFLQRFNEITEGSKP